MINVPKVLDQIVKNDLCIGCGICIHQCPSNSLEMKWGEYGFLIPELSGICDSNGDCLDVCPFNPFPEEEVKTENEISEIYLNAASQSNNKIGKYIGLYTGHANDFRLTSSSGGMATYILMKLLEEGIVDHIFSVKESANFQTHYEYAISSTKKDLLTASKTKYFPVTLGTVMPQIHELKGKVAIVGVACFIKAIRLAQHKEPILKEKIPFLVGIICGGIKSRFFTEYLAGKANVAIENIQKPKFRIKDLKSTAGDYSFGCLDGSENIEKTIKMQTVGDMWGTGMFKANACDYCDDVATELADISLGDAWILPYNMDGHGTNVIVTRTELAEKLITEGINNKKLSIQHLTSERFVASQQGSFNHRHKGMSVRLKRAKKNNVPTPPKRFGNERVTLDFKMVQRQRANVRKKSLEIWKDSLDKTSFDKKIKIHLDQLYNITSVYHFRRRISNLIKKVYELMKLS